MELVEGKTLRELCASERLPLRRLLSLAAQVADGLAKAHASGIIHRDLKPENVIVSIDGFPKILDFGLAKLAEPAAEGLSHAPTLMTEATRPGTILGTVSYMSPEQASGRPLDYRSDQFSLGSILYEMVTGRRAFLRETSPETLSAIIRDEPEPISRANSAAPAPVRWIVERCLAKDPEERYASTRDLARDLASLRDHISQASGSEEALFSPPAARTRQSRERLAWGLLAAVTLTAIVFAATFLRVGQVRPGTVRFEISTSGLDRREGDFAPVISPDGRRIAFVAATRGGKPVIWMRSLDAIAPQAIAGTEDADYPFWSPDGAYLAFFADGKLKRIASSGGPPQSICNAEAGRGGTWGREGTILFASSPFSAIHRVLASGGTPSPVTHLDPAKGEVSHRWPHFLPDGRHFIYVNHVSSSSGAKAANGGIYCGSLDGREGKLVLPDESNAIYTSPGYLVFYRDRILIAQPFDVNQIQAIGDPSPVAERVRYVTPRQFAEFSISQTGTLVYRLEEPLDAIRPVWFDRAGHEIGSLGVSGPYHSPRLSPDGGRVALVLRAPARRSDIWAVDTSRGALTRITADNFLNVHPSWFPEGRRIAYSSERGRAAQIFARNISGGSEQPIHSSQYSEQVNDISADGRFLVYSAGADPKTGWDLWVMDLAGKSPPVAVVQTPFFDGSAQFSPDGRWLAYVSDETGRMELYASPFPGPGARVQVSTDGGSPARWKRDGRELYYFADRKLMAADVRSGAKLEVGTPRVLFELRIAPRGSVTRETPGWEFDVSADGQKFLIGVPEGERTPSPITVVSNWTAELKK
jgi:Tol biopolymer transport system component